MSIVAVTVCAVTFSLQAADGGAGFDKAVSRAVEAGHPRLFTDEAGFARLRESVGKDTLKSLAIRRMCERAEAIVPRPLLKREQIGKRLLSVCRAALYRISTLAMAYRVTDDRRFLDRAVAELTAVCAFSDWNPSHFLDVGEMSLAVAIGYDWLYDELSPGKRTEILNALYGKSLLPVMKGGWWARARNNWGQVCRAGAIAMSLVLADDPQRRGDCVKVLADSVAALPESMKAMAPDGCYPEGPGYWHYGVSFNVFAIAVLESACGTDFGLSSLPGFWQTADYPNAVTGPTGLTIGYSDSSSIRSCNAVLWWFAGKLNRPDLLTEKEVSVWDKPLPRKYKGWLPPVELLWMDDRKSGTVPYRARQVWAPRSEIPIAVLRGGSGKDAAFAGIKGGRPSAPHGHMDGGNFVLDMGGVRWAWELACESYARIEAMKTISLWGMKQDSSRWSLFRLNTFGHNVPQIDGAQQLVDGSAVFTKVSEKPFPEVQMDLSSLYAGAGKVTRTCSLSSDGKTFEVRDGFEGLRPGAEITWKFITKAKPAPAEGLLVLKEKRRTLNVVRTGTAATGWSVKAAEGSNPADTPNKGYSVASFTLRGDAEGKASATVRFSL